MLSYEQLLLSAAQVNQNMFPALITLFSIFAVLVISTLVLTAVALGTRRVPVALLITLYMVSILTMACCFYSNAVYKNATALEAAPEALIICL